MTAPRSHTYRPHIFGIVNITEDSFSDGGKFLDPEAAIAHAASLVAAGADVLDIGPASSHPDARDVSAEEEIERLSAIWPGLRALGRPLSVDSFQPETQKWALAHGADWLNDINGFCDPHMHELLADGPCRLVVMHAIQAKGIATRTAPPDGDIWQHILAFFEARLEALTRAGVDASRMVLDPGMGFFLGNRPETSWAVLAQIDRLKSAFDLPVLLSVSRKSFLRALVDCPPEAAGPASLAAELFAARQRIDYIRTHDVGQLDQALKVVGHLDSFS
jgi:dihydropteroate synthase type 2